MPGNLTNFLLMYFQVCHNVSRYMYLFIQLYLVVRLILHFLILFLCFFFGEEVSDNTDAAQGRCVFFLWGPT